MNEISLLTEAVANLKAGVPVRSVQADLESQISDQDLRLKVREVFEVSRATGAAAQHALAKLVATEKAKIENQRLLDAEFAAPKATARLVTWLPLGVVVFAQVIGLPMFSVLTQSLAAQVSVAAGLLLLWLGARWSKRIIALASPKLSRESDRLQLMSMALSSGMNFATAAERVRLEPELLHSLNHERAISRQTGAPIAELVELRAEQISSTVSHFNLMRVREASVKLMVPLGATVLPALFLLLVIPVAVGFAAG